MFPQSVFKQTEPATLLQCEWVHDKRFVELLHASWISQYADYLGADEAETLVHQLIASGEIYEHERAFTLQASVDDQLVGIAALRPLRGISLITMLEVIPEKQGNGIGRQLIAALDLVSDKLMAHVSLHRPPVVAFYSSLGFHTLQRTNVHHYGHDLEFDVMAK
ncbi:MAG: GNAT family N-acetyltransferase [Granulosicoccus sp.]